MRSIIVALATMLVSSVAVAGEQRPGRCVIITEPGKAERLVCDVPPSEGCASATIIRANGTIVTKRLCVYTASR